MTQFGAGADDDVDGVSDACEQSLAEKYAPVVFHSSDESNHPTNVDWFLPHTRLKYYDDKCFPDRYDYVVGAPSQTELLGHSVVGGCGREPSTLSSSGTRSRGKHRTYFLEDVSDSYRPGSLDSRDWTTYFHAYPNDLGGVTVQYWRFYAYNDAVNNHGGDWEGVHLVLDASLNAVKVGFLGHTSIDYVAWSSIAKEGNHPWIFSEGGGHASHPTDSDVYAVDCLNRPAYASATDRCTSTRQETWTGGRVQWCRNQFRSACRGGSGPGGRLLNLGARTVPLNGQVFIQYSGIWGSPGTFFFTSGYWDPAYNETGMGPDGFLTAWCAGMRPVVTRECYPETISD